MKYLTWHDLKHPKPEDRRRPLPYSKAQTKRKIKKGLFPPPTKFGGPKSRDHWLDAVIDAYYAALDKAGGAA
jgi:hypothetical protein